MIRRMMCLLMGLMLLAGCAAGEDLQEGETEGAAEAALENGEVTEEELEEILALDTVDDAEYEITGKVWQEKNASDFTVNSPALYTGRLASRYSIFADRSIESKRLYKSNSDTTLDILYVGLQWLIVRHESIIGYSKRQWIAKSTIVALDPVNTPPLNVQKHAWLATTAKACHVRKTMDPSPTEEDDGNNWVILKPGTRISIWQFYDGWAMVNYMRSYGYIDPEELTDLIPVSPTDEELYEDCPIAAYTSYYKMAQTAINKSRIHNIKLGCGYISMVLQPEEMFNANAVMGPYNPRKGYQQAPVLVEGTSVPGYGGGTCQVSSTLYNVLIQLPDIEINYRRPHGGEGASYLPIHCDAAVGNDSLNLKFTNHYDFPIQIVATSNDDGALCITIYRAD